MNTAPNLVLRRLPFALLLMTICGGCAHSDRAAPASTSVQVSRECEHLAVNVADPPFSRATDPKLLVGEYVVALGAANGNLDATRTCQANQRVRMETAR